MPYTAKDDSDELLSTIRRVFWCRRFYDGDTDTIRSLPSEFQHKGDGLLTKLIKKKEGKGTTQQSIVTFAPTVVDLFFCHIFVYFQLLID